jgi:hypothetical protein
MYKTYLNGLADKDPSEDWYQSEIGFDFYIIPLAKKLTGCGVFGVASAEYLNYATVNKDEWKVKGKEEIAGYLQKIQSNQGSEVSNAR